MLGIEVCKSRENQHGPDPKSTKYPINTANGGGPTWSSGTPQERGSWRARGSVHDRGIDKRENKKSHVGEGGRRAYGSLRWATGRGRIKERDGRKTNVYGRRQSNGRGRQTSLSHGSKGSTRRVQLAKRNCAKNAISRTRKK